MRTKPSFSFSSSSHLRHQKVHDDRVQSSGRDTRGPKPGCPLVARDGALVGASGLVDCFFAKKREA